MEWNPVIWYGDSRQFLNEVRAEFRKVTWPSREEARAGTIGVFFVVVVLTLGLSFVDFVLAKAIQLILPS